MNKVFRIILAAICLQILVAGVARAETTPPLRHVLDNGMTVVLQENHRSPVVTIQAWVGAGSITEGEFTGSGISHFVEHMLFKGTERRSVGQIGLEVKECGGETNAYTSYDKTVYFITFHSDHFDKALDVLSDVIMNSVFDPQEVERERAVIVKEIQMNRDAPMRRLYMTAQHTAYAVHPYGDPIIGYQNLLSKISRDDLLTYYRRLYVPNNIVFVAVGDFDSEQALAKIDEAFKGFERASITPAVIPQEPPQQSPREYTEAFDVTVAQSMMGFHGPSLYSDDMYAMDVLAIALGGGDTSRLYRDLREAKGIVYEISAWSATPRDPGMFWIMDSFEPENEAAVKDAVWEQIEKLKADGIKNEELETARAKVLSDYVFSNETVEGQARSIGSGEVVAHDIQFDKHYVEAISRVTAADIQRVIEKYFRPENSVVVTLMPRAAAEHAEQMAPEETAAKAGDIEQVKLPNGLTVLLREDHGTETVSIRLHVLGGARAENASDTGITNLMSDAMLKGTTTRSAEEIARAIESRGGSIGSFSGYNSFGFNVDMLSRDLKTGLDILGDIVANPAFSPEEVDRERTAAIASIKQVDDEVFPSAMRLFRRTMFGDHPYGFLVQGNADVVQAISSEDLRQFHDEAAVASRMVLSIFGDIDRDEALESAKEYFGGIPSGAPLGMESSVVPVQEPRTAFESMNKEQLAIFIGFPGKTIDDPERYPLELLAGSLNSQGGKLFQTLRDERGLAYAVGAFHMLGVEPGAFVFYIVTDPLKADAAISGIFEVIDDLRRNGISEADLERTKSEVMGTHAIDLQTNGQLAAEAAFDELYGLGYDAYKDYDARMRAITADDVKRVAAEVFDLDKYVLVAVGNLGSEEALKSAANAASSQFGAAQQ